MASTLMPRMPAIQRRDAPVARILPSAAKAGRSICHPIVRQRPGRSSSGRSIRPMTEEPVPYVALICPGAKAPCAKRAECESPMTAKTGVPSRRGGSPRAVGNGPVERVTLGSALSGILKSASKSGSQVPLATSRNWVRDALPISMTGSSLAKRLRSHESTVPMTALPASNASAAPAWWRRSQAALGAENMGSSGRPLRARTSRSTSGLRSASHSAALR
jgi:hypothetical protein